MVQPEGGSNKFPQALDENNGATKPDLDVFSMYVCLNISGFFTFLICLGAKSFHYSFWVWGLFSYFLLKHFK